MREQSVVHASGTLIPVEAVGTQYFSQVTTVVVRHVMLVVIVQLCKFLPAAHEVFAFMVRVEGLLVLGVRSNHHRRLVHMVVVVVVQTQ